MKGAREEEGSCCTGPPRNCSVSDLLSLIIAERLHCRDGHGMHVLLQSSVWLFVVHVFLTFALINDLLGGSIVVLAEANVGCFLYLNEALL